MQAITNATNLSNWTLSLVLGAAAALKCGAREGIPGELPISDTLLGVLRHQVKNGVSGDNVFIGRDTRWARMMLKSFETRKMKFSYLLIDDKAKPCPECKERCPMVIDPMTVAAAHSKEKEKDTKDVASALESAQPVLLEAVQLLDEVSASIDPPHIRPNMFYSLVTDYVDYEERGTLYKVVHKPECIPRLTVDKRATEFLSDKLSKRLSPMSNHAAIHWCKSIIDDMCEQVNSCREANEWDRRIIERIQDLMLYSYPKLQADEYANEVMDRIHSRLPAMLERLGLDTFTGRFDDIEEEDYTIADIPTCFIVYFGIQRAIAMSERIHDYDALVFMGYNINLAHEIIRDLTEIQSQNAGGYSSRLVVESTASGRVVDRINEANAVFVLVVILDAALSTGISILSRVGPVLSMYTARLMTAPYRESCMHMGTSMRWSALQVSLMHSGTARDDWMVCIKPDPFWRYALFFFVSLSLLAFIGPVIVWPFISHTSIEPIEDFGRFIAILSSVIGTLWVSLATSSKLPQNLNNYSFNAYLLHTVFHPDTIINFVLLTVLFILVYLDITIDWVYLYLLEGIYFIQWLIGEYTGKWIYQSTAWFMLGALGAFRLSNVPDDN
ncbi:hypothetical protein O0I10_007395 [Lichtheimia ornata]|uniref:Uncharacterized protein n=1 Tax=Lichtheimia ornata TaxID=688661 RepID=A0AAD7V026_9FUNG|nr:uncharacterized protein O0I10_007395 [Lichtheimia ornata]KAJ8656799.1 hypothetical protein O0I10_007395 [Lichtheimia ornata]